MADLKEIVAWCDERVRRREIADFDGALNGLQLENSGKVTRIGAAVDAGIEPFRAAIREGVDFLIVHHGMFWSPLQPLTGHRLEKLRVALDGNLAVYGSHLPLDCHPEIGNNALLAKAIGLKPVKWFLEYEGTPLSLIASCPFDRAELAARLRKHFPHTFTAIECGSANPERIAVLTGSGRSAIPQLRANGVDTLITGELRQEHFNVAQELQLNLYPCGHYATETFGVRALAEEAATKFGLEHTFIQTDCPL